MIKQLVTNTEKQHRALKLRIYPNPEQEILINKNYCYHFAQSVSSKTVKPNFRKAANWTDKSKDTLIHDYPLH